MPRLRQRLHRAPPGCGRPFWADDPAFDVRRHVLHVSCPAPGDERSLLDTAAAVITRPLPRSRPLWSATFVTGLAGGGTGLVIVMDHVLAADAWAERAQRLAHLADSVRTIRLGVAEMGGARTPHRLRATSLNRPTGRRRRLDVVAADLAAVRELGHACGGTVNDVILAAVAGALRTLLAGRGEELDSVTMTVPVSARRTDTAGVLGNPVGGMMVTLRAAGGLADRVTCAAAVTRGRKRAVRGTSVALLGPAFDGMGADVFTAPAHRAVRELIGGCGGVAGAGPVREWVDRLLAAAPNDNARMFLTRLAVEPVEAPGADGEPDARFADGVLVRIEELAVSRQIVAVKSRLQRMNPVSEQAEYNRLFGDLVALEQRRKLLAERSDGE